MFGTLKQQKRFLLRIAPVALLVLWWPASTFAFFSSAQTAPAQQLQAGFLSLEASNAPGEIHIGEAGVAYSFVLEVQPTAGSLPAVHDIEVATAPEASAWCDSLSLSATTTSGVGYSANLSDFATAPEASFGEWAFAVESSAVEGVAPGTDCTVELTVTAWQHNLPKGAGYTDQQNVTLRIVRSESSSQTISGVVLNEIYPNEDDSKEAPLEREWVELFNPTGSTIDIEGWSIGELVSGTGAETTHLISSTHTCEPGEKVGYARPFGDASTVIPAGGLLVIEFCAANRLFNEGDTITLYDGAVTPRDRHTYSGTIMGKAHSRIPDDGTWVDPIPTPGEPNTVTVAELRAEGWSDAQITSVREAVSDYDAYFGETQSEGILGQVAASRALVPESPEGTEDEKPQEEEPVEETAVAQKSDSGEPTVEGTREEPLDEETDTGADTPDTTKPEEEEPEVLPAKEQEEETGEAEVEETEENNSTNSGPEEKAEVEPATRPTEPEPEVSDNEESEPEDI